MTKKDTKLIRLFLMALMVSFLTSGCSSSFKEMEKAYDKGYYLESAEAAVEGLRESKHRKKVISFLEKNSDNLYKKIKFRADVLQKRVGSEDPITYLRSVVRVTEELQHLDASIDVSAYLDLFDQQLKETVREFVSYHYRLAIIESDQNYHRRAVSHLRKVLKYAPDYKDAPARLSEALLAARRVVSFTPFYRAADPITKSIAATVTHLFTGREPDEGDLEIPIYIDDINVTEAFNQTLYERLQEKRSEFLTFTLESEYEDIPHTEYYIEGRLNAFEFEQTDQNQDSYLGDFEYQVVEDGEKVWKETTLPYIVYSRTYKVQIMAKASIYFSDNDEKVQDLIVDEVAERTLKYRERPSGLPENALAYTFPDDYARMSDEPVTFEKQYVIREAVQVASDELTKFILKVIDKDKDPLSIKIAKEKKKAKR